MFQKLKLLNNLNKLPIVLLTALVMIGLVNLYSAAGGNINPWALKQGIRAAIGMVIMLGMASISPKVYFSWSYVFYGVSLVLLIGVEALGFVGMGAQRWIDLYFIQIQPSELMKIAAVMALARYLHCLQPKGIKSFKSLLLPGAILAIPALLVMRQPDLGTALVLLMSGSVILFVAGLPIWYFIGAGIGAAASIPILWTLLHDYQKKRVLIFLDPSQDSLGSGYHITQSKIALGSGGMWGRGYMEGSQAYLNFLPEKQTDFIFTMFCEEHGFIGAIILLVIYILLIGYGMRVALNARANFSRLMALGIIFTFFIYMFVNMAMVMGLLPVVGVPLPLVSYGGTAMLTLLMGFGLLLSVDLHRNDKIPTNAFGVV